MTSCKYGAECGLVAQCECGCCLRDHECECDELEEDEGCWNDDYDEPDEPPTAEPPDFIAEAAAAASCDEWGEDNDEPEDAT